ncbi:MAG: hypothetical protein M3Y33_06970 [Actinomycetota bacterium]|nr:hypothetical protein [Actinomycetota bacterium]
MAGMDISGIFPAIITGVVGVAGIAASLIAVRSGSRAEDRRSFLIEKRRVYAEFNAAVESLWFTVVSSEDFTTEPGRSNYNETMKRLWGANYKVALITSGEIGEIAGQIASRMTEFGKSLIPKNYAQRIAMAEDGPEGEEGDLEFEKLRELIVCKMREDLEGSRRRRNYSSAPSNQHKSTIA